MAVIDIGRFSGEVPRVSPKLLSNESAETAQNCDLDSGNLKPIAGITSGIEALAADVQTIFRQGTAFLTFDSVVDVARSFVSASDRLVYTGDGYPKEFDGTNHIRLGIAAPSNALTIHLDGTPSGTLKEVSYVYTLVSKRADGSEVESAPSPATAVTSISDDIGVSVSGFTITGLPTGMVVSHYRLYRINAGETGAEYQFVMDLVVSTTGEVADTVNDADLGEVLPTEGWTAPNASLTGIKATSHGMMYGFVDNTIYPSEVFIPYAYPEKYSLTVESDIVGLGYTGSMVVVLTKTVPYLLFGNDPETLELKRLGYAQPCLSARSIVDLPGGVVYAAPDGLFMITESGEGKIITQHLLTRKQWAAKTPSGMIGVYYDDSYLCFSNDSKSGFQLNLATSEYQVFLLSQEIYGGMYSPEDDKLYLIQKNGAVRDIASWRTGSDIQYTWMSKKFSFPSLLTFSAGIIQGTFGSVSLVFYIDGVAQTPITVTSDSVFRLPTVLGSEFQAKVIGTATIDRIRLGGSVSDVLDV